MDVETLQELDEYLRETVGDGYHGVIECREDDGLTYEEHYLREDIREHYSDEDRAAMAREAVFRSLEESYLESIYQLGDRRFGVEYFEHASLLFFAVGGSTAAVVGLDPSEDLDHTSIGLDCLDVLEE